jgi:hypothetical protein
MRSVLNSEDRQQELKDLLTRMNSDLFPRNLNSPETFRRLMLARGAMQPWRFHSATRGAMKLAWSLSLVLTAPTKFRAASNFWKKKHPPHPCLDAAVLGVVGSNPHHLVYGLECHAPVVPASPLHFHCVMPDAMESRCLHIVPPNYGPDSIASGNEHWTPGWLLGYV